MDTAPEAALCRWEGESDDDRLAAGGLRHLLSSNVARVAAAFKPAGGAPRHRVLDDIAVDALDPEVRLALQGDECTRRRSFIPRWYQALLIWSLAFGVSYQLADSVATALVLSAALALICALLPGVIRRIRDTAFL